jgi:ribonuclease Z
LNVKFPVEIRFQVIFLGTGSAEPNKFRGSSAIFLRMASGGSVLLDAGEGAAGALVRGALGDS